MLKFKILLRRFKYQRFNIITKKHNAIQNLISDMEVIGDIAWDRYKLTGAINKDIYDTIRYRKFIIFKGKFILKRAGLNRGMFKISILKYKYKAVVKMEAENNLILSSIFPSTKKDKNKIPKGIITAFSLDKRANIDKKILKQKYSPLFI